MVCYLISGAPHHIELKSQAFDDPSQKHEHTAKLFSNCFLSAPVYAYVCDSSGNKTPLRTTLNLSWTPSSCGLLLTKRAQKGEAVFESNTMKCGTRSGDQQVKLKVFSSDHKNLTVSLSRIVYLKSLCRLWCFASVFVCFDSVAEDLWHLASSNLIYRYNVFALDVIWLKTTVFLYFNLLLICQPTVAALRCPRDIIYFSLQL